MVKVSSELFDLAVGAWLLVHELIRRECKDLETLVPIPLV